MRRLYPIAATLLLLLCLPGTSLRGADASSPQSFFGCCDGSAVVALDQDCFAVASDEDNVLRIYDRSRTNAPVWQRDFSGFLQLTGKAAETDLEGAARIGDVIYWIGSHSRNAEGRERPNRQRLFATRIAKKPSGFELEPVGQPCRNLLPALLAEPRLAQFKLKEAAELSPEQPGGLNIEGLAATPGGGLLIAFRNPLPAGKALIVPLENPAEAVAAAAPRLGAPILLELGQRGVRDLALAGAHYFIVAGGVAKKGKFELFEWNGADSTTSLRQLAFGKLSPEGVCAIPVGEIPELLFTSDDSSLKIGDCDCKDLPDPAQRRFRVLRLRP